MDSLFVHSSADGHLDCFYFMTVLNNAAVNIHACLCNRMFSFLLGIYLGIELQGFMVILLTAKLFSKVIMLFTFLPVMYEGHHFSTTSPTQVIGLLGSYHPRYEVLSHRDFDLHFPDTNNVGCLFTCILAICISSLENWLHVLCSFVNWVWLW